MRCYTRALKNARYLQQAAPHLFARQPSGESFGTGIPMGILSVLHRLRHDSPVLRRHQAVADFLKENALPRPGNNARDALFSGTIHFVQITFQTSGGNIVFPTADLNVIVQYAQHAIVPISEYAGDQYGLNTVSVSPTIILYNVNVPNASYTDGNIQGWVNDIVNRNNLPSNSCIFVVSPQGLTAPNVSGNAGYHGKANVPYIVAGVFAQNLTLQDVPDVYAMVVSHEIAEMIVDPNVDGANPEVCDPCDINCGNLTRAYFDLSDNYLGTNQASPPSGFGFSYYICAVVKSAGAANCPASTSNCEYAPVMKVPTLSVVTDLTRFRDHIDLFTVGFEGGVYSTFWDLNGGWFNTWFRIIDPAFGDGFTVPPQSVVSCLSRFRDHIDLFAVGRDSGIYSTFWDVNGGWFNHWFRLMDTNFPDGFKAPIQSTVSCLSRFQNHIDLFVVGFDGGVYSTFWDANGGWFNRWFRLIDTNFGDGLTVPPQSTVSCLSRFQNHIDLFAVGRDGGVYSTFWDANGGWFNRWFRLIDTNFGDGFTVPPQSTVSCLSRFQNHIDLFVVGRDGGVYSTFWDANGGWFNRWFRLMDTNFGDGFTAPPGSVISNMSRFQDHIDLFVVGRDGAIYSTFWDLNGGWFNHWFRV